MKKITLLALLFLTSLGLKAQSEYSLSVAQEDYVDLQNSTSINNNTVWDYDDIGPFTMPFNFSVAGVPVNRFLFTDDYFAVLTPDGDAENGEGMFLIPASTAWIQDRTYDSDVSSSPISYKVEGETGNRILKLEVKNAGLETDPLAGEDHYINFQVWLYENNSIVEIRYGQHNITSLSDLNDENVMAAGIISSEMGYMLYENSVNPTYGEFTVEEMEDIITDFSMEAFPANGTVYRLTPSSVAGTKNFTKSAIALYPNPAASILNLKADNLTTQEYGIYNVTGKLVSGGKLNSNTAQINIAALETGIYFIKIDNQYLKFIKQ